MLVKKQADRSQRSVTGSVISKTLRHLPKYLTKRHSLLINNFQDGLIYIMEVG